jgi:hypothetical protein
MTYTFDENCISDLHKDAYGFRPSQSFWSAWAAFNGDQKQAMWDDLCAALTRELEYQREQETAAVKEFDAMLVRLYQTGAKDFEQAMEWTHTAYDTQGDDEYLEFRMGLPFGHIRKTRTAMLEEV